MATHAKNHDYHILPPSIWPLMGAVGGFLMLFGLVLWTSKGIPSDERQPWVFLIGLAAVLYVMFAWWSEVVAESQVGDHTPVVRIGLRYGFIMFIMSEVMFFAAWFWAFFKARCIRCMTMSGQPMKSRRSFRWIRSICR